MSSTSGEAAPDLLAVVRPALHEAATFISDKLEDPYCSPIQHLKVTRSRIFGGMEVYWPERVDRMFTKFVVASAGVILRQNGKGPGTDETSQAEELVRTHLEKSAEEPEMQFLPARIAEAVEASRQMQRFSEAIVGGLQGEIADDEERYGILRLLSEQIPYPGQKTPDDKREAQTLQAVDIFTFMGEPDTSLMTTTRAALEAGSLDGFIAAEVLHGAMDDEVSELDGKERAEVRNLLELGRHLLGMEDAEAAAPYLLTDGSRAAWPQVPTRLFHTFRNNYMRDLDRTTTDYKEFLVSRRCLPAGMTTDENLGHIAEDLLLETARIRSKETYLPMPDRIKAKSLADKIEKKRRNRAPAAPSAIDASLDRLAEPAAEETPVRRKLAYIKSDGSKAPEGSPECDKIFDDYLADHRDQNGLAEDLERIKEYLKTMDLSQGIPRGVYTLGSGQRLKRGDSEFSKIYQLKPSKAVGLPLSSPRGAKIRVLFVLENNTVGLLGIAEREKAPALMRNVGVRGRPRRK